MALQRRQDIAHRASTTRWRTDAELLGFALHAADGAVGRIEDFSLEEESWGITEIVVAARRPRRRLFIPLGAVERVDWQARTVHLWATREEIAAWWGTRRATRR
jgi:hypothetical protein